MKSALAQLSLLAFVAAGCAVATVDPESETDPSADLGDGDDDAAGGSVVVTTGGSSSLPGSGGSSSGGMLNTGGGLLNTGGTTNAGGAAATGGQAAGSGGSDPSGCLSLDANDKESGSFGTTDEFCIIVDFSGTMYGWRSSGAAGRTITINGQQVSTGDINPGPVPMPGSAPYLVEFTAGDHDYTDFAFW